MLFWQSIQKAVSLSARRAWIEIVVEYKKAKEKAVALRKESVDRNIFVGKAPYMENASLSARRAWIEIASHRRVSRYPLCRSPQGERG